jgi:hypothetical protein
MSALVALAVIAALLLSLIVFAISGERERVKY